MDVATRGLRGTTLLLQSLSCVDGDSLRLKRKVRLFAPSVKPGSSHVLDRRRNGARSAAEDPDKAASTTEILICTNRACRKDGSLDTVQLFRDLAPPGVKIDTTGCKGKCGNGPNLVMLPEKLLVSHCNTATHVARLLALQCGAKDPERNLKALNLKHQANAAFEGGKLARAVELYSEAITLQPSGGLHNLYANRSAAKATLGDYQGAVEDAEIAAKVAPDWAGAVMRQAEALAKLGNIEAAAAAYNKAATMDSTLVKKVQRRMKELGRQAAASQTVNARH